MITTILQVRYHHTILPLEKLGLIELGFRNSGTLTRINKTLLAWPKALHHEGTWHY